MGHFLIEVNAWLMTFVAFIPFWLGITIPWLITWWLLRKLESVFWVIVSWVVFNVYLSVITVYYIIDLVKDVEVKNIFPIILVLLFSAFCSRHTYEHADS